MEGLSAEVVPVLEKPVHRGRFAPGEDPRRFQVRGPKPPKPGKPVRVRQEPVEAANPVLTAYRAVLANLKRFDRGGLELQARKLLEDDNKAFLAKYTELEREEGLRSREEGAGEDGQEDRVVGLLADLLERVKSDVKGMG